MTVRWAAVWLVVAITVRTVYGGTVAPARVPLEIASGVCRRNFERLRCGAAETISAAQTKRSLICVGFLGLSLTHAGRTDPCVEDRNSRSLSSKHIIFLHILAKRTGIMLNKCATFAAYENVSLMIIPFIKQHILE